MVWGKKWGNPDSTCAVGLPLETLLRTEASTEIFIPNLTLWKCQCGIKNMDVIGENRHDLEIRFMQGNNIILYSIKNCQSRDKGFLWLLIHAWTYIDPEKLVTCLEGPRRGSPSEWTLGWKRRIWCSEKGMSIEYRILRMDGQSIRSWEERR